MMLLFDTEVARCHQHVTCQERRSTGRGSVISMLLEAIQRHHVWNQDCHKEFLRLRHTRIALPQNMYSAATEHSHCYRAWLLSDPRSDRCCHLGIATEHAIYACSFATALRRLCYRASYKMREACERIFPSSACSAKQTCARVRSYPTTYYLFGVHAQVSY